MSESRTAPKRRWRRAPPGRFMNRGHAAGDFLEAYKWKIEKEELGRLSLRAHVPEHVRNPRGQLFGGFTPTYIDLVALFTTRAGRSDEDAPAWLATTNMRIDYLAPVEDPEIRIESHVVHHRARAYLVEARMLDNEGTPLVFSVTSLLEIQPSKSPLGDG